MGNYESLAILIAIALTVYIFDRKNFTREGIVFLRRTKKGLLLIDSIANKHPKLITILADAGIVFSFGLLGLRYTMLEKKTDRLKRIRNYATYAVMYAAFFVLVNGVFFSGLVEAMKMPDIYIGPMTAFLAIFTFLTGVSGYGFMTLFFGALSIYISTTTGDEVSSSIQLVLPVDMPADSKAPVFSVPFAQWLISIMFILVVHEFSHAIVARKEKIRVKSMGYGFFGIIPLGFAEPDEEEIKKSKSIKKTRIYGAGSFSNILAAIILLLLYIPVTMFGFASGLMTLESNGILIEQVNDTLPAKDLPVGGLITFVDGQNITTVDEFVSIIDNKTPGDNISFIIDDMPYEITLIEDPDNRTHAKMGVVVRQSTKEDFLTSLVYWIVILNIGIALANLFPLKPLDGGLMLEEVLVAANIKDTKTAANNISKLTLLLLLFSLLMPWFISIF